MDQLVCHPLLMLGLNSGVSLTLVTLMTAEEITNCKSYIATVSLTDWCIIFYLENIYLYSTPI